MPAYSGKAQPYLDAIADSIFTSQAVRDWLITGTSFEANYRGASVLIDEQRVVRWRITQTKQLFGRITGVAVTAVAPAELKGVKGLNLTLFSFFGIIQIAS